MTQNIVCIIIPVSNMPTYKYCYIFFVSKYRFYPTYHNTAFVCFTNLPHDEPHDEPHDDPTMNPTIKIAVID